MALTVTKRKHLKKEAEIPIYIMLPTLPDWEEYFLPDQNYLIIDGHNRAYLKSRLKKKCLADLLESDEDLIQITPNLDPDHIIKLRNITTLQMLEQALLDHLLDILERESTLPIKMRTQFYDGQNVD